MGKERMESSHYHLDLFSTAACSKRLMEETKGLGQRDLKGSTRDCSMLGSWFLSNKSEYLASSVGVDLIGMLKTNTTVF